MEEDKFEKKKAKITIMVKRKKQYTARPENVDRYIQTKGYKKVKELPDKTVLLEKTIEVEQK